MVCLPFPHTTPEVVGMVVLVVVVGVVVVVVNVLHLAAMSMALAMLLTIIPHNYIKLGNISNILRYVYGRTHL